MPKRYRTDDKARNFLSMVSNSPSAMIVDRSIPGPAVANRQQGGVDAAVEFSRCAGSRTPQRPPPCREAPAHWLRVVRHELVGLVARANTRLVAGFSQLGGPVAMPIIASLVTLLIAWRWRSWFPLISMTVAVAGSLTGVMTA